MHIEEIDDCDLETFRSYADGTSPKDLLETSSIFSVCGNLTTVTKAAWQLLQLSKVFEEQSQGELDHEVTTLEEHQLPKSLVQVAYDYGIATYEPEDIDVSKVASVAQNYGDVLNRQIHDVIRDLHINDYSSHVMPSIRVSHGDRSALVTREKFIEGLQALPLNRGLSEEHANQVVDCVIRDLVLRHKGAVSGDELIQLSVYYLNQLDFSIELGVNYQRLVDRQTSDLIHRGLQDLSAAEYSIFMRSFKWGL